MNREAQSHAAYCELVAEVARRSGEVRLKVTGASMLPSVWPGDVVTVRSCDLGGVQPGQIVLYRREGKLTAHRIICVSRDHLITRGDSIPTVDPPVRAFEIVGQVVSILHNGRCIDSAQSFWQCVFSSILRRSDFCARITLLLGRRLRRCEDMQVS